LDDKARKAQEYREYLAQQVEESKQKKANLKKKQQDEDAYYEQIFRD
jgi:hypothetical protein